MREWGESDYVGPWGGQSITPQPNPIRCRPCIPSLQEHAHGSRAFFGGGPFAFFVAGVALLAVAAYHVSRRQLAATATHAALQSEYSPSSPRITYDRAAAAAASVAAQHQQQQKDRGRKEECVMEDVVDPASSMRHD